MAKDSLIFEGEEYICLRDAAEIAKVSRSRYHRWVTEKVVDVKATRDKMNGRLYVRLSDALKLTPEKRILPVQTKEEQGAQK